MKDLLKSKAQLIDELDQGGQNMPKVIAKPVAMNKLAAAIRELLDG